MTDLPRTVHKALDHASIVSTATETGAAPLVELRVYKTRSGFRDDLVNMFEAQFLDIYQAAGALVVGSFIVEGMPDQWVWISAFSNAAARGRALRGFYNSEVWRMMRGRANRTISDSTDALLLRAEEGGLPGFQVAIEEPAPKRGAFLCIRNFPTSLADAVTLKRIVALQSDLITQFDGTNLALLSSAADANTYPRQSLRLDLAVVSFARFQDQNALLQAQAALSFDPDWCRLEEEAHALTNGRVERFRLNPTTRSAML